MQRVHQSSGLHRRGLAKNVKGALPQRCIISMGMPSIKRIGVKATDRGMQQSTNSQLCVRPLAIVSGGPWRDQAALGGAAPWFAEVVGASGSCEAGLAATTADSGSRMRWPGQGRTSGGEPRQQTQPRLNSRKSSASRRGPCVEHTGAAGTPCSNGWFSSTVELHRMQTHSGVQRPDCLECTGAQCICRSGNSSQAASDAALAESARNNLGQQNGRM